MTEQLANFGLAFTRTTAIDGKMLTTSEKNEVVNQFRWWCAIGLSPRDAEIGCALSHVGIYKQLIKNTYSFSHICILEDDVQLSDNFPKALNFLDSWVGNEHPRVVLLSDHTKLYDNRHYENIEIKRSTFGYCTDAYVINRLAAEAILRENFPLQRPCDHWRKWVNRDSIELYHCLPTVAHQAQEQFGTSTQEGIQRVKDYPMRKWCIHKIKRFLGKTLDWVLG